MMGWETHKKTMTMEFFKKTAGFLFSPVEATEQVQEGFRRVGIQHSPLSRYFDYLQFFLCAVILRPNISFKTLQCRIFLSTRQPLQQF